MTAVAAGLEPMSADGLDRLGVLRLEPLERAGGLTAVDQRDGRVQVGVAVEGGGQHLGDRRAAWPASMAGCSDPSRREKPPTMAKSFLAMLWASLATVPEEKALSMPLRIELAAVHPALAVDVGEVGLGPDLGPLEQARRWVTEMSLMEPTVMELAVTPGAAVAAAPAAADAPVPSDHAAARPPRAKAAGRGPTEHPGRERTALTAPAPPDSCALAPHGHPPSLSPAVARTPGLRRYVGYPSFLTLCQKLSAGAHGEAAVRSFGRVTRRRAASRKAATPAVVAWHRSEARTSKACWASGQLGVGHRERATRRAARPRRSGPRRPGPGCRCCPCRTKKGGASACTR